MKAALATLRAASAEAWGNRSGFWTQVAAMLVNDIWWVAFWALFFNRIGTLRGWDADLVMLLLSVLCTSAGLSLGLLGNARRIGHLAVDGGLDAALALPVPPLVHILSRRVDAVHLGDVFFGIGLFAVLGNPTVERTAIYLAGVAIAAVLLTGFLVTMGSLAFFFGRNEAGDLGFHCILLFSSYPVDVFAGAAKVFLYTLVPAAFVSTVPAKLVDSFDAGTAVVAAAVAAGFAVLGWGLFTAGLRRYTSGAVWTRA
jgi:ABC-2 type transport system permease protein